MPGPLSVPSAKDSNGHVIAGKTALRHAKLKSREGMTAREWQGVEHAPKRKPNAPKDRNSD